MRDSHPGTFEWLFDENTVSFSRWLSATGWMPGHPTFRRNSSNGSGAANSVFKVVDAACPPKDVFFWVQGKPGSGKSTLMKFALKHPRLADLLPDGNWTRISFLFHDRGTLIQRSLTGMLRELLFQLLSQHPEIFHEGISAVYKELK